VDTPINRRQGVWVEVVLLAMAAAAGAGALWLHQQRAVRAYAALPSALDTEAEVALHVAGHEARTRAQAMSTLHVLYGLLQDETITAALVAAELDPVALEDRTLAALDAPRTENTDEAELMFRRAWHSAHSGNRKVTHVDLWAYLAGSEADALLVASGVSRVTILFRLFHRMAEPAIDALGNADVHVVLRNDDYTTREFVCEILKGVFGYNDVDADTRMMQTHTEGRGIVGRFTTTEAREKILDVRKRAHESGFPLWIGIEPI